MQRDKRRYAVPKAAHQPGDSRGEFRRDHDRLYYSSALRRLTGITQVVAPQNETAVLHNRYVHSDKVAILGRALAEHLVKTADPTVLTAVGPIDPDVVAAAGLAHDIGHPPFGHAGEAALHKLALDWHLDGFEGNAQTFRVLTKLAVKKETHPGIDLTAATRNAVLKYPWKYGDGPTQDLRDRHRKKWCVYRSEEPDFIEARATHTVAPTAGEATQSLEAAIMELADDISYALHDFEDFYRAGLISIETFRYGGSETYRKLKRIILSEVQTSLQANFDHGLAEKSWTTVLNRLLSASSLAEHYRGARQQDAEVVRLTSTQITAFTRGIGLKASGYPLAIEPAVQHEIAVWKQLTRQFVINQPGFAAVQIGQQRTVAETAKAIRDWVSMDGIESPRIPERLRDYYRIGVFDEDDPAYPNPDTDVIIGRAVLDYVASLTEPQLVALHEQLTGAWRSSMLTGGIL